MINNIAAGRKIIDIEKNKRRIDSEKNELILVMEDLEFSLEKADSRTTNVNKVVEKIKLSTDIRSRYETSCHSTTNIVPNVLTDDNCTNK